MLKSIKIQNTSVYAEPLALLPYAQSYITRYDDGTVKLTSYRTDVALIHSDGKIECYGLYSATTRKHISAFARQFGYTYNDFKQAYLNGDKEV